MTIEHVSNTFSHGKVANSSHVEGNQSHIKTKKAERFVDENIDSVDISKETRNLEQSIVNLKTRMAEIPDVRIEKMEEVRAKLRDGFYDSPEVIEQVADKVIDAFIIKN